MHSSAMLRDVRLVKPGPRVMVAEAHLPGETSNPLTWSLAPTYGRRASSHGNGVRRWTSRRRNPAAQRVLASSRSAEDRRSPAAASRARRTAARCECRVRHSISRKQRRRFMRSSCACSRPLSTRITLPGSILLLGIGVGLGEPCPRLGRGPPPACRLSIQKIAVTAGHVATFLRFGLARARHASSPGWQMPPGSSAAPRIPHAPLRLGANVGRVKRNARARASCRRPPCDLQLSPLKNREEIQGTRARDAPEPLARLLSGAGGRRRRSYRRPKSTQRRFSAHPGRSIRSHSCHDDPFTRITVMRILEERVHAHLASVHVWTGCARAVRAALRNRIARSASNRAA